MAEHPAGDGPGDRCKHFLPHRAKFVKVRAEVFHKEPARLVTPRRKQHFARSICCFSRTAQLYISILVHSANRQIVQEYV